MTSYDVIVERVQCSCAHKSINKKSVESLNPTFTMLLRCFASAAVALLLLEPSHAHSLRAINSDSSCNGATDESSCLSLFDKDTGTPCVWCKCAAIPSECLTQEQAKQLPEGVFDCSPSSFLKDHVTLVAHAVEDDLCDKNSKSGYLSVKGSKYDENKEDKYLFYWMFEKRNQQEGEMDIPFVVWLTGGPGCSSTLVRIRRLLLAVDAAYYNARSHFLSFPTTGTLVREWSMQGF